MKQKWILTGAAFSLAAVLSGCSNIPVLNQLQNSQVQTQTDSMGETKEQTVPAQTTPTQTDAPVIENSTGEIDEARAKEIALAHAGVPETEASITKLKLDYEDGRQEQRKKTSMNGSWITMIIVRNMRARSFTVIWNTNLLLTQIQAKFLNGIWTLCMIKIDPYGLTTVHRDFYYLFKSITWRTGQLIQYQVKYAGLVWKDFRSDLLTSHKPGAPAVFWAG